jgi:hypothetical protein
MNTKRLFKGAAGLVLAATLTLGLGACDSILDVTDPDLVVPETLTGAQGADLFWAGAIGDFAWAMTASGGGQAIYVGLFTDEYHLSGTFPTREEVDQREVDYNNGTLGGMFNRLHRARVAAKNAAETLEEIDPSDPRVGEMWNLNAYLFLTFGENYCSGVPFGDAPRQGDLVLGEPATTTETYEMALARFDLALAESGSDTDLMNLARVGKARTLMNLNRYSEAAGLVGSIATDWAYLIQHSDNSGRQQNSHYEMSQDQERWSISDNEGINGLPFRSANDPRVPWEDSGGNGFDETTRLYHQMKYPSWHEPVVLASGHEARYIEAEAALATGDGTTFLSKLNEVRADFGMDDVVDPGTADGRVDLLFYERAFTFWGDGHRLGDLRRLVRQYGRAVNTVFPSGDYFKGGIFGNDVDFVIPQEEENNPNFVACLERGA